MPRLRQSRSPRQPRSVSRICPRQPLYESLLTSILTRVIFSLIGIDERAYMDSGTVCISLPQGAVDSQTKKPQKATVVMANDADSRSLAFSTSIGKTRSGIVILLGLMLTVVPGSVLAQSSQQQQQEQQQREQQAREQQQREQQAREEQQRQEQQREQQAREQQQREQQAREEQQRREQQQREQQAREQQQREQQAREEQQRQAEQRELQQHEQQTREQQQREQQAREQQERNERQREEQERQRQTPVPPTNSVPAASPSSDSTMKTQANAATESRVRSKAGSVDSRAQAPEADVKARAGENRKPPTKDQNLRRPAPDLRRTACEKQPCAEAVAPSKTGAVAQACPAGQIWNGIQCAPVGVQQCVPGQIGAGASCQENCTIATAGAQSYIEFLRMARQDKDQACTANPNQQQCQEAESTYNIRLNEYRTFLAGVSTACTLPDPISI